MSEVPRPAVGFGDVLVRVEAAGINHSDIASVQGKFLSSVLPRIVGRDFAGTVVDASSADIIGAKYGVQGAISEFPAMALTLSMLLFLGKPLRVDQRTYRWKRRRQSASPSSLRFRRLSGLGN
jgi:Alcohol dehydrogenase GroES-like domain